MDAAERLCRTKNVVRRDIAGEVFLVPIRGHLADLHDLFIVNEVGSFVWERLDGSRTVDDLVTDVTAEFEVGLGQAHADVTAFLGRLLEAELAERAIAEA